MKKLNKNEIKALNNADVWCAYKRTARGNVTIGNNKDTFPLCTVGGATAGKTWKRYGNKLLYIWTTEEGEDVSVFVLTGKQWLVD